MGNYTDQMSDMLFQQWRSLDDNNESNEEYQGLISSLNSQEFFRTFGEGLLVFLQKRQPTLTAEAVIKYIESLCVENGVSISDIASTNTLKSWFKGGPRPKKGEDSRLSMFALAFALQLSPDETAELFHKVYLDRAFDYRNEREIVYYFCLQHKKSWSDAKYLIESAESIYMENSDYTVRTSQIRTDIDVLIDEAALLNYIAKHGHNLAKKNVAAKNVINRLIEKTRETAESETNLIAKRTAAEKEGRLKKVRGDREDDSTQDDALYVQNPLLSRFADCNPQSYNYLYEVIVGLDVHNKEWTGTKTLFKNARLPREIRSRFPEAGTLSKKNPTYEELRKLIILLASYNHWYWLQKESKDPDIEVYSDGIDEFLNESGFPPMYCGNPYDWLFLFCTLTDWPLDTFRAILAEVLLEE